MKGFRNFLYNNSDIFVALAIIACAGLLIAWKMDVLLHFNIG